MQVGISRNQLSSTIRTNGCTIKVDTKKDETQRFEVLRWLGRAKRGGGEIIECKEIVVEGKDNDNHVRGQMRNSGRGYPG